MLKGGITFPMPIILFARTQKRNELNTMHAGSRYPIPTIKNIHSKLCSTQYYVDFIIFIKLNKIGLGLDYL